MRILKFSTIIVISLSLFLIAGSALAVDWWPIVPCGLNEPAPGQLRLDDSYYQSCTNCDLFKLAKNIIDFILMGLMPPVAVLLFVWAGFLILTAGASPGNFNRGTKIFSTTFWGIVIIMLSWMITNTLIKSLVNPDIVNPNTPWWEFQCKETVVTGGGPTPTPTSVPTPTQTFTPTPTISPTPIPTPGGTITPTPTKTPTPTPSGTPTPSHTPTPTGNICLAPAQLAKDNNEPYPATRAPELNTLLSCIARELGQQLPPEGGVSPYYGSMYTYDHSALLCNYTRGQRICTPPSCSHAVNSCHYGGRTGTQGSLAVDFGNELKGDTIIQAAIDCGVPASKARCENAAGKNVGCTPGSGANHIHIGTSTCDAN